MGERTLRDIALHNYRTAIKQLKFYSGDERDFNVVGYLLQQASETFIKHFIEEEGYNYPRTHDMSDLIKTCKRNDVTLDFTERFKLLAGTLTIWETQTRYVKNFLLELEEIKLAIDVVREFFLLNGVTVEELEPKTSQLNIFD